MRRSETCVVLWGRPETDWRANWNLSNPDSHQLIKDPCSQVPGFSLKRREWVTLNIIRTGHGRCGEMLFKRGMKDFPACDCGHPSQTISGGIAQFELSMEQSTISTTFRMQSWPGWDHLTFSYKGLSYYTEVTKRLTNKYDTIYIIS